MAPKKWPLEARECRVVDSPFVEMRKVCSRGRGGVRWCRPECRLVNGLPCQLDQGNRSGIGKVGRLCFAPPVPGLALQGGVKGGAASCCACVHSGHSPHCLRAALSLLIAWAKSCRWATNRGSLLGATSGFVEGHCHLGVRWGCRRVRT